MKGCKKVKNNLLKVTLFGVGIGLLTGCASNTQPVRNTNIGSNNLIVKFENSGGKQKFTEITNKKEQGFFLNNFQPVGFDTGYKKLKTEGVFVNNENNFKEIDKYTKIGCEAEVRPMLIIYNIFPLNWLLGGICDKAQYFDFNNFDEDAKSWVEDNKINSKEILSKFDELKNIQYDADVKINELANAKYSVIVDKYYQDGEKLKSSIFSESKIQPKYLNSKRDKISYKSIVDGIFPCKTDCLNKIDSAIKDIQSANNRDKDKFETSDIELTQLSDTIKHYLQQYKVDLEKDKKSEDAKLAQISGEKSKQEEQLRAQKLKDAAIKKAFEEQMKKIGE